MMIPPGKNASRDKASDLPASTRVATTIKRSRWVILSSLVSLTLLIVVTVIAIEKWREPKPTDGKAPVSHDQALERFNRYNRESFFPLATGTEWAYAVAGAVGGGVESVKVRNSFFDKKSHTYRALVETIRDNTIVRRLMAVGNDALLLVEEDDGAVFHRYDPPLPALKYPLKEGDRWTWTGAWRDLNNDVSEQWTMNFTVEGRETLTVADRVFTCLRIRTTGRKGKVAYEEKAWYAVSSGLIRRTTTTGNVTEEWKLQSFKASE